MTEACPCANRAPTVIEELESLLLENSQADGRGMVSALKEPESEDSPTLRWKSPQFDRRGTALAFWDFFIWWVRHHLIQSSFCPQRQREPTENSPVKFSVKCKRSLGFGKRTRGQTWSEFHTQETLLWGPLMMTWQDLTCTMRL